MTTTPPPAALPPPATPAPKRPRQRPMAVTVAAGLMMLIGITTLISTAIGYVMLEDFQTRFAEDFKEFGVGDDVINQMSRNYTIEFVVDVVVNLLFVMTFSVLAMFNLRGNAVTRVITWVVCGLFLLCALVIRPINIAMTRGDDELSTVDPFPAWYDPVMGGMRIIETLSFLAIVVLLALPQSNRFFRQQFSEVVPPQA